MQELRQIKGFSVMSIEKIPPDEKIWLTSSSGRVVSIAYREFRVRLKIGTVRRCGACKKQFLGS